MRERSSNVFTPRQVVVLALWSDFPLFTKVFFIFFFILGSSREVSHDNSVPYKTILNIFTSPFTASCKKNKKTFFLSDKKNLM